MIERTDLGRFSSPIVPIFHIPAYGCAILVRDFTYIDCHGVAHRAQRGLITDGITNPRLGWRVLGPPYRNEELPAAVIHDHYCEEALCLPVGPEREQLRLEGDRLFRFMTATAKLDPVVARESQKIAQFKPAINYRGVRLGARSSRNTPPIPNYVHERAAYWRHKGVPTHICMNALAMAT